MYDVIAKGCEEMTAFSWTEMDSFWYQFNIRNLDQS